ncbi:MAG: YceK/YidQ family lipoprotein [bacterium]
MKSKNFTIFLLLTQVIFISGCASLNARTNGKYYKEIYPGIKQENDNISEALDNLSTDFGREMFESFSLPFYFIDWPLSFIIDTLLLPYDIIQTTKDNEVEQNEPENSKK